MSIADRGGKITFHTRFIGSPILHCPYLCLCLCLPRETSPPPSPWALPTLVHPHNHSLASRVIGCRLSLDSMRRRSSDSTDQDDSDEPIQPEPRLSEDDGRKRSFTSAKFDLTRQSDTLDRRKAERTRPSIQLARNASSQQANTSGSFEKLKPAVNPIIENPTIEKMVDPSDHRRACVRNPWRCSLLTWATTALSLLLFFSIVHSMTTRQLDPKGCNNCRMRPAYAKLSDFDTEHTRFASKYSLYLYREGGIDEDTMVSVTSQVAYSRLTRRRSRAFLSCSSQATLGVTNKYGL